MNLKTNMTENTFNLPPLIIPKNWNFYHYQGLSQQKELTIDPSFNSQLSILFHESLAQYNYEKNAYHNYEINHLPTNNQMIYYNLYEFIDSDMIDGALALTELDQLNKEKSLIEILRTTLSK